MTTQDHFWRYSILGILLCTLPILVVLQIIRIQVSPDQMKKILKESETWAGNLRTIVPARGQIYDRDGNLLAGNQMLYEVGIELQLVEDPETVAQILSTVLEKPYGEVLAAAQMEAAPTAVYAVIANNVTQEKQREIEALIELAAESENVPDLDCIVLQPQLSRIYPEKALASNIIGFVSREGRSGRGYFGLEERYQDLLAGKVRTVLEPLDPNRVENRPRVPNGASLITTIDLQIQKAMEELIDQAVNETGSSAGTIVVIDPRTGEILAMAISTRMDLNEFWRYSDTYPKDTPFNPIVSESYEPGSVFKVLTMASALDSGAVNPDTVFVDTGAIEVGGLYIYNWNLGAWGPQNMQGCMQHSLNVCLAWVATELGTDDFYPYLQAFGIGRLTGIDLAGEVSGRLKSPGDEDWYAAELGTNAFGQGVAVTPVQMAAAISAIANDGKIMAPHIVRSVVNEGYQHDIEQRVVGIPIRAETARTLTEMLARSLEIESSDALVTGYRVAGKTGTAEIPTPSGYTSNQTNASFVGWGPVDDPHFLVYVWLEKPSTSPWGSVVAAPLFRQAVEQLVVLMDLPPDDVRRQLLNGN
jgi:cell division protein FtsI/penicillin-binding protein 2